MQWSEIFGAQMHQGVFLPNSDSIKKIGCVSGKTDSFDYQTERGC